MGADNDNRPWQIGDRVCLRTWPEECGTIWSMQPLTVEWDEPDNDTPVIIARRHLQRLPE
jgi:hypothetical protein